MQAGSGGVGELYQAVELGLGGVAVLAGEGLFLLPPALPLLFDGCEIVLQINHALLYFYRASRHLYIETVTLYPQFVQIARASIQLARFLDFRGKIQDPQIQFYKNLNFLFHGIYILSAILNLERTGSI